jgi:hypothetical protein
MVRDPAPYALRRKYVPESLESELDALLDANQRAARFLSFLSLALGILVGTVTLAMSTLGDHHQHVLLYSVMAFPAIAAAWFGQRWQVEVVLTRQIRARLTRQAGR